jgi:site-specific recombinase XerD
MPSLIRNPRSGIYYAIYRENKKQIWRSLRTRNSVEAHKEYTHLLSTKNSPPQRYIGDGITEYLDYVKASKSPQTYEIYKHSLQRFLTSVGNIPIENVNLRHMDLFISQSAKTMKNVTLNTQIRAIKSFFSCCKRWQITQINPIEGTRQLRVPQKIPAYMSYEELHRLLEIIKSDQWLYDIVKFAAYTGARLGEITNLDWKNIDLENRNIYIQSSINFQVKSGKMRTIPMSDEIRTLLVERCAREGLVFKGRRRQKKIYPVYLSRQFKKAIREHGFNEELHFHSLRHTFASILAQKGVSLHFIQKLLGHSNISVTQIYSHLETSNLRDAIEIFNSGMKPLI